jgi:ribosomal protein S18 acetylase RimI-like enzyme
MLVLEPGDVDAAAANEANLRGWLPVFERFPGARIDQVEGCARWLCDVPLPLFNGVIGMPTGGNLEASIAAVLEPFDAGGIRLLWALPTHETVVVTALEGRGFAAGAGVPGMTIALADLPPFEVPANVVIEEVDGDPESLRDAATIALTTNGLPPMSVDPYLEALDQLPERSTIRTFLAARDGAPLATSTLVSAAGVAGLYNVGTLPDARRTGLGRLVSVAAMVAGRDAGYRVGVLQSSPDGEPVYRAIGFEERARFTFATRMPATT